MTPPNPEVDELILLLDGLTSIETMAHLGLGSDDASNAALKTIQVRVKTLIQIVRSVDETNLFGPEELGRRMAFSPRDESKL